MYRQQRNTIIILGTHRFIWKKSHFHLTSETDEHDNNNESKHNNNDEKKKIIIIHRQIIVVVEC